MQKIWWFITLARMLTQTIADLHDKGRQSIGKAVLADVDARIASGNLPHTFREFALDEIDAALNAHPDVRGHEESDEEHLPMSAILAAQMPAAPLALQAAPAPAGLTATDVREMIQDSNKDLLGQFAKMIAAQNKPAPAAGGSN